MARPPVELRVDAAHFRRVLNESKAFSRTLERELRANLRSAAAAAANEAKREVMKSPLHGEVKYHKGLRAGIAAGIKIRVVNSRNRAGVYIVSGGTTPAARALAKNWDKPGGWTHPYWGHKPGVHKTTRFKRGAIGRSSSAAKRQVGRPYFGTVIVKDSELIESRIRDALAQATAVAARTR